MSDITARISWFAGELVSIDRYLNATPVVPSRRMVSCTTRHVTPTGELHVGGGTTARTSDIIISRDADGQGCLVFAGEAGFVGGDA